MLAGRDTLQSLLRQGVENGNWIAYKRSEDPTDTMPGKIYHQETPVPASVDLLKDGYSIMTLTGAKKRGWTGTEAVANEEVKSAIRGILQATGASTVRDVTQTVQAGDQQIRENIQDMLQGGGYSLYSGDARQADKPAEMINSFSAFRHEVQPDEVLISDSEQGKRGWNTRQNGGFRLDGNDGARKVFPILKRLGSLYTRSGATSTIDRLDITELRLPGGGTLRIALEDATPTDMKRMDELFAIIADVTKVTPDTEAELRIGNPDGQCALIKELKK